MAVTTASFSSKYMGIFLKSLFDGQKNFKGLISQTTLLGFWKDPSRRESGAPNSTECLEMRTQNSRFLELQSFLKRLEDIIKHL